MKRIATGLCAALLLFSLVGCSDATTNVSDKNEALITIGTDKITKGDVYNGLVAQGDISPVVKALTTAVAANAIETTDEIKAAAQANVDTLKASATDWEAYLKNSGYESEEALLEDLINQVKETKITSSYVSEKYTTLATRLEPRKLQVVSITNKDVVNEAQQKANDGVDFTELAKTYGDGKQNGVVSIYTNASGLGADVWKTVLATEEGKVASQTSYNPETATYYLIKVIDAKTNEFKDEAISVIAASTAKNEDGLSISEEAFNYYLNKVGYGIHDAIVYSALLSESAKYERVK